MIHSQVLLTIPERVPEFTTFKDALLMMLSVQPGVNLYLPVGSRGQK